MTTVYVWLRYANLGLAVVLTVAMLFRSAAFLRAPVASRYGRLQTFAWTTAIGVYGTAESLVLGTPAGPRVPSLTGVLVLTGWWVWTEYSYDRRALRARAATSASLRRGSEPLTSLAR